MRPVHSCLHAALVVGIIAPALLRSQEKCPSPRLSETDSTLLARLSEDTTYPTIVGNIERELTCRAPVPTLIAVFNRPTNRYQRASVLDILYHIDDPRVTALMRTCASAERAEEPFECTMYLAKGGDTTALAVLNQNYYAYPISSWEWSYAVALFGTFRYRAATANLVESLNAASLNVAFAADSALRQLYPKGPKGRWPSDSLQADWTRYLRRIGVLPRS
jgi:hypothetical protein